MDKQAGVREANWIVKKGARNGRVSFFLWHGEVWARFCVRACRAKCGSMRQFTEE